MNLNKIVRQFSDVLDRLSAIEKRLDALAPKQVDSQPPPATIATQQVSERPHRTLTLPRKELAGGYSGRAKRETSGGD